MSEAAWLHLTKCPRPPGSVFKNVRGRLAPSSKCPRLPGSVLENVRFRLAPSSKLKPPNFHGNRLEFKNSDSARLLSSPRTFTVPSLVTIGGETAEEIAHKHFRCPRMPGSVFCQIIVRYAPYLIGILRQNAYMHEQTTIGFE